MTLNDIIRKIIRKARTPINREEGNYELPQVYDDAIQRHRY